MALLLKALNQLWLAGAVLEAGSFPMVALADRAIRFLADRLMPLD